MATIDHNRTYGADGYSLATSLNPFSPEIGDPGSVDALHSLVIEFDIDPATIDSSLAVTLDLSFMYSYSTTEPFYIRRWDSAFPTTGSELTEANTTDQILMGGATSFDLKTLVAQAETNSDTKFIIWLGPTVIHTNDKILLHDNTYVNTPTYTLTYTSGGSPPVSGYTHKRLFPMDLFNLGLKQNGNTL